jgi:hypothetical protein
MDFRRRHSVGRNGVELALVVCFVITVTYSLGTQCLPLLGEEYSTRADQANNQ